MAAIDYSGIEEALAAIFKADARTSSVPVFVEEDPVLGMADHGKALAIFLNDRTPTPNQPLAAGKRTRYYVGLTVWVVGLSLESFRKAAEYRDALLAQAELVLMDNRTLSGTVAHIELNGGSFDSAISDRGGNTFCALASIRIRAEALAVNT